VERLVLLLGVQRILQVSAQSSQTIETYNIPFVDVVKTRIQSEPHRYKGLIDCMKRSYYEEGWRIFFKGLTPTILRAFPSNAATFAAYTWIMNVFQSSHVLTQKRTYEEAIL
jgi:solute carrier family 25 carnitine/acylcarnitine transporter 20/29